tara:strand:+ start:371 stop:625 length:255 start_codon:yes stop_codon:yes gene_type:complete
MKRVVQSSRNKFVNVGSDVFEEEIDLKEESALSSPLLFYHSIINRFKIKGNRVEEKKKVGQESRDEAPQKRGEEKSLESIWEMR